MTNIPNTMKGVQLIGHGGFEKLHYREDIPVPKITAGEVLIEVLASSVNNTDINTRIGWYSKSITTDTNKAGDHQEELNPNDASWSGIPLQFPRIQGADCVGRVIATAADVDSKLIGKRVLVRTMMRGYLSKDITSCCTFGSECDGSFAEYTKAPIRDVFPINSDWHDIELGTIPCAYSTAEGLLHRAQVKKSDRVLISGASGGVGSAALQLAKARGAHVIAISGADKVKACREFGADEVIKRGENIVLALGANSIDVVIDLVAGDAFSQFIDVLKPFGRYATSGAIAGPIVNLDVRSLYLKDLTFYGCTFQPDEVFMNVIHAIEQHKINPLVAQAFPLTDIVSAQQAFLSKRYAGKIAISI